MNSELAMIFELALLNFVAERVVGMEACWVSEEAETAEAARLAARCDALFATITGYEASARRLAQEQAASGETS
ncbi:MAG: hypothetical protein M1396_02955 [Chloroflexi bacterium]|nr:hypothetical protein [Chloroflexota bacterium]